MMPTALLVWRNRALGDSVLAIPALQAARASGWQLRVVGYVEAWDWLGPLAPLVAPIESAPYAALLDGACSCELAGAVGDVDAALALSISRDYQTALRGAGVPHVLQRTPVPPPGTHAADWLRASLLVALRGEFDETGADPALPPAIPALPLDPDELAHARQRLATLGVEQPIYLHLGAGCEWKCWSVRRFAQLANALVQRGHEVVLTEGVRDGERIAALQEISGAKLPTIRQAPRRELGALLALGRCYVGADCGVSHLAAASGVPTLALFGPTDPASWVPRGPYVRVIRKCQQRAQIAGQIRVCDDPDCLATIGVDEVLEALSMMVEEAGQREAGSSGVFSRIRLTGEHRTPDPQHRGSDAL